MDRKDTNNFYIENSTQENNIKNEHFLKKTDINVKDYNKEKNNQQKSIISQSKDATNHKKNMDKNQNNNLNKFDEENHQNSGAYNDVNLKTKKNDYKIEVNNEKKQIITGLTTQYNQNNNNLLNCDEPVGKGSLKSNVSVREEASNKQKPNLQSPDYYEFSNSDNSITGSNLDTNKKALAFRNSCKPRVDSNKRNNNNDNSETANLPLRRKDPYTKDNYNKKITLEETYLNRKDMFNQQKKEKQRSKKNIPKQHKRNSVAAMHVGPTFKNINSEENQNSDFEENQKIRLSEKRRSCFIIASKRKIETEPIISNLDDKGTVQEIQKVIKENTEIFNNQQICQDLSKGNLINVRQKPIENNVDQLMKEEKAPIKGSEMNVLKNNDPNTKKDTSSEKLDFKNTRVFSLFKISKKKTMKAEGVDGEENAGKKQTETA